MLESDTQNTATTQAQNDEDTSLPGEVHHEDVTTDSDPRDQRLELIRLSPPKKPGQKLAIGKGRMEADLRSDKVTGWQVPQATVGAIGSFRAIVEGAKTWVEGQAPGSKFEAACIYAGVPRVDGSSRSSNFWFAQILALDLDGAIRSQEEFERLQRALAPFEHWIYSTASHDVQINKWRLRVLVPMSISVDDWELYGAVGEWWLAFVAMALGCKSKAEAVQRGLDLCTKKPFQPMLLPRYRDEDSRAKAVWIYNPGSEVVRPDMAKIQAQLEADKKKEGRGVRASTISVQDDGTIDRLEAARSDLARSGYGEVRPGEGRSDAGLWRAACTFRDWCVPMEAALREMISRYVPMGHEESRVHHKVTSAYERTDDPRYGWRLRAALTGPMTLTQIARTGENVTDGSLKEREESSVTTPKKGITTYAARWQRALDLLPQARVLYRRAPQGTGKTETLRRLMDQFRAEIASGSKRVVLIVHRVSLAKNLSRRLGLPYYKDPSLAGQIEGSCVVCLDSVGRVALERDGDGFFIEIPVDVLIVDESEQVVRHLFGETIEKKFASIWSHLKALFNAAKNIIAQDADLGRVTVDATRILLGWDDASLRDEHFEINEWRCGRTMRWQADEATLQRDLLAAVKEGGKHAVYCTSKTAATALVETLEAETGRRILGITAETSGSGDAFEVLEDPSDAHEKWDVIVYTGSANTGITIDVPDTWNVWGFIRGGAGPTEKDALQGLCRVRNPAGDVRVWVGGRDNSIWWTTNPERNLSDLLARNDRTRKIIGKVSSWDEKYIRDAGDSYFEAHNLDALRLLAIVMAEEAASADMVEAFKNHATDSGWVLVEEGKAPDEERAEAAAVVQAGREAAEEARRRRIKEAEVLSIETAKARVDAGGSREDHAALEAAIIRDFYGIRRTDPITDEVLDRDDRGRYRSQVRLFIQVLLLQRGHVQAVLAPTVRSAKADPTGVTWDHRGTMAATLARVWAIFGVTDLEKDAEAGTVLQIPKDLPMGPQALDRFRRELHLRAPSIRSLSAKSKDGEDSHQNVTQGEIVTDGSLKEREESSVTISRKQWGYILRGSAAKMAVAISWEQVGAGQDRGKRIGRLDTDRVHQILQDGKRYMERLMAGAEWRDPLIDDLASCPVTVDDLLADSEVLDLPSPVARTEGVLEEPGQEVQEVQADEEPELEVEQEPGEGWAQGMIDALLE